MFAPFSFSAVMFQKMLYNTAMLRFIYKLRKITDATINLMKWPVVLILFPLVLPMLQSTFYYYKNVFTNWQELWLFLGGFGFMVFSWVVLIGRKNLVASTMEHEMTHAIFALLTFHNVTNLEAHYDGNGVTSFQGGRNWLITIAPYFFPTLSVGVFVVAVITYMITGQVIPWLNLALGMTTGYHFLAVIFEIHPEQTDLQKVGFFWAFLFIPSANLLSYVLMFAVVDNGISGVLNFLNILYRISLHDIMMIVNTFKI